MTMDTAASPVTGPAVVAHAANDLRIDELPLPPRPRMRP
jgi:hypothetical protein